MVLRRKLTARRAEVSRDHDRHIRIERLGKASKKCDTTAASRQSTSLAKEYVDKVCAAFTVEAKGLGLDRVPVELVFDRTTLGVSFIKVALVDAPNISVATVLSEGEQRMTAVAGFFADLTESGDESILTTAFIPTDGARVSALSSGGVPLPLVLRDRLHHP